MAVEDNEMHSPLRLDQQNMEGTRTDKQLIDVRTDSQWSTPLEVPHRKQYPVITREIHSHSNIKPSVSNRYICTLVR